MDNTKTINEPTYVMDPIPLPADASQGGDGSSWKQQQESLYAKAFESRPYRPNNKNNGTIDKNTFQSDDTSRRSVPRESSVDTTMKRVSRERGKQGSVCKLAWVGVLLVTVLALAVIALVVTLVNSSALKSQLKYLEMNTSAQKLQLKDLELNIALTM